jgi:hypothetical protein
MNVKKKLLHVLTTSSSVAVVSVSLQAGSATFIGKTVQMAQMRQTVVAKMNQVDQVTV